MTTPQDGQVSAPPWRCDRLHARISPRSCAARKAVNQDFCRGCAGVTALEQTQQSTTTTTEGGVTKMGASKRATGVCTVCGAEGALTSYGSCPQCRKREIGIRYREQRHEQVVIQDSPRPVIRAECHISDTSDPVDAATCADEREEWMDTLKQKVATICRLREELEHHEATASAMLAGWESAELLALAALLQQQAQRPPQPEERAQ